MNKYLICKKVGIAKATTHDLRHTWNTVSKMKGLSEDGIVYKGFQAGVGRC